MNTHILTFDIEHWYDGWRRKNLDGWQGLPDCDTSIVDALLDLLDESGRSAMFFFTSSFFPKPRYEYARRQAPHKIILPSGKSILEIPATALRLGLVSLPYGGAYFRLFPARRSPDVLTVREARRPRAYARAPF